ncbi:unnamed protein product [Nezara viridula]|uniref:Uncharacterized protein n=1 Tax=Nezara viridula TaxID=85310 RepID=A0A9P0HGB2_NEZVI|nr:unnamed protein product [Nezara viridula]
MYISVCITLLTIVYEPHDLSECNHPTSSNEELFGNQ